MLVTDKQLLYMIDDQLGDVDELIEVALYEETCAGACTNCNEIHYGVKIDAFDEYCDECGERAVKSLCVLAGVA